MTSFNAGTPASGAAAEGTSFQAEGGAAAAGTSEDTTIVFEHGGRKFTKADLAKKLDSADGFIEQLKSEGAENRKALEAATKALQEGINATELLKQIKAGQSNAGSASTSTEAATREAPVTVEAVVQQIEQRQAKAATDAQRKTNWNEVTTALTKAFGAAVDQKVAQVAAEAGMTLEQAADMARNTPKAFLKLFPDLSKKAAASPLPASGKVNTQAFHQAGERKGSGYAQAQTTKELVSIYQQRLAEVSAAQ